MSIGYEFEAFSLLQDICTEEQNRVIYSFIYRDEKADNLEQLKQIKKLLRNKFKLAGHINADFFLITSDTLFGDERTITIITLCVIKILYDS